MHKHISKAKKFLKELNRDFKVDEVECISKAFILASKAHETQKRDCGSPYIVHPIAVAKILSSWGLDYRTISSGLLHDVVEDTEYTLADITNIFGSEISSLVDGVSKIENIPDTNKEILAAKNFVKMFSAMYDDIRVFIIKLADRLHNMRTVMNTKKHKRKRMAKDTLLIYAPMAHTLGINDVFIELEDLSMRAYYPLRYKIIKDEVIKLKMINRERCELDKIELSDMLNKHGIKHNIFEREIHIHEIYTLYKNNPICLRELVGAFSLNIVIEESQKYDCHKVLRLIHSKYLHIPSKIRDYVSIPQDNGYQSIHTTIIGGNLNNISLQIRDPKMHKIATIGVLYKWPLIRESKKQLLHVKIKDWLDKTKYIYTDTETDTEFLERTCAHMKQKELYVFTIGGDIKSLPIIL